MKRMAILLWCLAMLAASVQPAFAQDWLESQLGTKWERERSLSSTTVRPNEIIKGNVTYSGIGVELFKTDNLLQLINPAAAPKYGSGEANVLRDPSSGRVYAWKLFSLRF